MDEGTLKPSFFSHLHVHSQYSLLDSSIRIQDLLAKCKEFGMSSVAITDHGDMSCIFEFYQKAKDAGIKPIVGCEFYITPGSRFDKSLHNRPFHLVLLAMNKTGYVNLLKLNSIARSEGYYFKPRIDQEILAQFNEGVIALTACLHGEIPCLILNEKDLDKARKKTMELKSIFGDRLYLELQQNGRAEQVMINKGLMQLADELNIALVATNDCHYLNKEDAKAHDVLLCLQCVTTLRNPLRMRFSSDDFYFKSPEEMEKAFIFSPEAIANTKVISDRCNLETGLGNHLLIKCPDFFQDCKRPVFVTMKAKMAVRLVGRALGLSLPIINRIAQLIPNGRRMTIIKAMADEPDLQKLYEDDEQIKELLNIAIALEGLPNHIRK